MSGRRTVALLAGITAVIGATLLARPYARGLSFVVRAADMQGTVRAIADLGTSAITERRIDIAAAAPPRGSLAGRLYSPSEPRRMVLLVSGLHPAGIDEPRLVALARHLAASGLAVVTPDIPELTRFEMGPAVTDDIERAALWLARQANTPGARVGDGRVGLMGISFSGGLSVVASGRSTLGPHVAYVFSLGGHDDLPRVLRYLCTGSVPLPAGRIPIGRDAVAAARGDPQGTPPPHDYGVAVILLGVVHRLVPRPQVEPLRAAVRRFLEASTLDRVDKPRAEREFAALRAMAALLPEPSATLLRYVNDRDVVHLGARLLPYVGQYGGVPALSPSKAPKPSMPVFLLHGRNDNVIPAVESEFLADGLRGRVPLRLLLSDLISHATLERPPRVGEVLELASFWADLLDQ